MDTELVAMSTKELERSCGALSRGRLTQAKAGEFIGLSERQVPRVGHNRGCSSGLSVVGAALDKPHSATSGPDEHFSSVNGVLRFHI